MIRTDGMQRPHAVMKPSLSRCALLVGSLMLVFMPLSLGPAAEQPVQPSIVLEKRSYALGETFSFTITTTRDCHFLMFTIDANDRVEIHDPTVSKVYMGDPLLRAS